MFDIVLKAILFLSPICYPMGTPLETFDMLFFRIASVVLFMAYLIDKSAVKEISLNTKYLIASLLGIGVFNVFINTFHPVTLSSLFNLQLACLDLFLIITKCRNHKSIFKWIVYAGLVNVVSFLFQQMGNHFIFTIGVNEGGSGGLIGNKARLATYLALIVPFAMQTNFISVLLFFGVSFWGPMQFSIALCFLFSVFLLTNDKKIKILLGCVVILFCGIFFKHILTSLKARWDGNMKFVLDKLLNRPLLGYGLGGNPIKDNAEVICNSFLQFIVQVGFIGFAWIIYAIKKIRFTRDIETVALYSMFALMMIEYPLAIQKLWLTMIAIVAFAIIKQEKDSTEEVDDYVRNLSRQE